MIESTPRARLILQGSQDMKTSTIIIGALAASLLTAGEALASNAATTPANPSHTLVPVTAAMTTVPAPGAFALAIAGSIMLLRRKRQFEQK